MFWFWCLYFFIKYFTVFDVIVAFVAKTKVFLELLSYTSFIAGMVPININFGYNFLKSLIHLVVAVLQAITII